MSKYLVAALAISSVYGSRIGGDPMTWTPDPKKLACGECVSLVNRTETSLGHHACLGVPNPEKAICKDVVSLVLEKYSPVTVCQEIGYCPKKSIWSSG